MNIKSILQHRYSYKRLDIGPELYREMARSLIDASGPPSMGMHTKQDAVFINGVCRANGTFIGSGSLVKRS